MSVLKQVVRAAPTLGITILLVAAWMSWHHYSTHYLHPAEGPEETEEVLERTEVVLGPEKIAAAKIVVAGVEPRTSKLSVVIPGRVSYDPAQLVSLRLGSAGILTHISVRPGDRVEEGQVLATINSPEVGTARADQLQRWSDLELAKRQLGWDKSRSESIRKLVDAIKSQASPEDIRKQFSDQLIGDAREKLLSAYTDKLLAASNVARITSVAESGAISSRTIDERKSNLDARQAALQSTIEQTLFDADRAAREAQLTVEDAQRRWEIATGRVTTCLDSRPFQSMLPKLLAKRPNRSRLLIYRSSNCELRGQAQSRNACSTRMNASKPVWCSLKLPIPRRYGFKPISANRSGTL